MFLVSQPLMTSSWFFWGAFRRRLSLLFNSFLKDEVIQGRLLDLTLASLRGICLSMMYSYRVSHARTESSISSNISQISHGAEANSSWRALVSTPLKSRTSFSLGFSEILLKFATAKTRWWSDISGLQAPLLEILKVTKSNNQVDQRGCITGDSGGDVDHIL